MYIVYAYSNKSKKWAKLTPKKSKTIYNFLIENILVLKERSLSFEKYWKEVIFYLNDVFKIYKASD